MFDFNKSQFEIDDIAACFPSRTIEALDLETKIFPDDISSVPLFFRQQVNNLSNPSDNNTRKETFFY